MSYNDFYIYSILGENALMQYKEAIEIQKERDRQKRKEMWGYIGSVLIKSIKPTVEFIDDFNNVESEYPKIEKCLIAGKYAVDLSEIAYHEHLKRKYSSVYV
jgi:hypothetical protein